MKMNSIQNFITKKDDILSYTIAIDKDVDKDHAVLAGLLRIIALVHVHAESELLAELGGKLVGRLLRFAALTAALDNALDAARAAIKEPLDLRDPERELSLRVEGLGEDPSCLFGEHGRTDAAAKVVKGPRAGRLKLE